MEIYYQNIRGCRSKTDDLLTSISIVNYDIICLTETWLMDSVNSEELFDNRYEVYRRDRRHNMNGEKSDGGGVLIAVNKNTFPKSMVKLNRNSSAEDICVTIIYDYNKKLHLFCAYLPGYCDVEVFKDHLNFIQKVRLENPDDKLIALGDFNCSDYCKYFLSGAYNLKNKTIELINSIMFCGLSQYSCIVNINNVLLDLVFSNFELLVDKSEFSLVPIDVHHPPLLITFSLQQVQMCNKLLKQPKPDFFNADYTLICNKLDAIDWNKEFSNCIEIDQYVNSFYSIINNIIRENVKSKRNLNKHFPVYFSRDSIKLCKKKLILHRKWKKYKNICDYIKFSLLREQLKARVKIDYQKYITQVQENIKDNIKSFWSYVDKRRKSCNGIPAVMQFRNELYSGNEDIANAFADNFESVYAEKPYNTPELKDFYGLSISNITMNAPLVYEHLSNLDIHKGAGPDNIPPIFLKKCASFLAAPLETIFNKSLAVGIFPTAWKISYITPIHKGGAKNDILNYRPISKLSCIGKVFESIVTNELSKIFLPFIIPEQHGFVKGRSTTTNLLGFTEYLHQSVDKRVQVDTIYTDFSKAFDKVNFNALRYKLLCSGVFGDLLNWIMSYLTGRFQAVSVNNSLSRQFLVKSGVPQGSHLGPLLFILFINDISTCFKFSKFLLYADDLKIFSTMVSANVGSLIQHELNLFFDYCSDNCLELNISKCHVLTITRNKSNIFNNTYILNNTVLEKVEEVNDLGITIDSKLSFIPHIHKIQVKAYKMLGFVLRTCRGFRNLSSILLLFKTLVRPKLEYASTIWNPNYAIHIQFIESIQRKFAHFCVNNSLINLSSDDFNYIECLSLLNLSSLEKRRCINELLLLHKTLNNTVDSQTFISYISFNLPSTNFRHHRFFRLNLSSTNTGKYSPITNMMRNFMNYCENIDIHNISLGRFKLHITNVI